MLTSIACPTSSSTTWVAFAGTLSKWLVQPLAILPILFLFFALAVLIPRPERRQPIQIGIATLALIYLFGITPPTINAAELILEHQIPRDSGTTADAIVVLGRGQELTPSRVEVAEQLWQTHRAPLIFASGVGDAPRMLKQLEQRGVPAQDLQGEECSHTTYENAEFTAQLLKPQHIQTILLVTDEPHMWRSTLTFHHFGFDVIPVPSSGLKNLNYTNRTRLVMREYMGLASYGFLGRFSAATSAKPAQTREADARAELKDRRQQTN